MTGLLLGLVVALAAALFLLRLPCASAACESPAPSATATGGIATEQMVEVLDSFDETRRHMRNRLAMLDEMIAKADREIDTMQQRLSSLAEGDRRRQPTPTERAMLRWLQTGGFDPVEIAALTGFSPDALHAWDDDEPRSRAA